MAAERPAEGLHVASKGLETADENSDAELYRCRGELLLMSDFARAGEAEACFRSAIDVARKQCAKFRELSATLCLVRLLVKLDRRKEGRRLLANIYNWFTEGFDTADLKEARALLDELRR